MTYLKGLAARTRSILGRQASESRMEEEFRFHVEMETARLINEGRLPPTEARRQALATFGGLDVHREAMRDGRGARWFSDIGADVRYALRAMRKSPGFAVAVAVTLGLGIGVNGLVFGYVDALLFRPVPARNPEQLVGVYNVDTKSRQTQQFAYDDYLDFKDRSGVFAGMAGMVGCPLNLVVPARSAAADLVWGEMVTENFFSLMDMQPALGRFFAESDGPPGANPFVVLSYDSWIKRFNGDNIVGQTVRINGSAFTMVGVAPRGFKGMRTFGFWPEMWVPLGMHNIARPGSVHMLEGRGGGPILVVGRMREGDNRAKAEAAAARFATQLENAYPATNVNVGALVVPGAVGFDDPAFVKPSVLMLASGLGIFASLVTMMIICANLANLQLARAAARVHEIAIRLSLGCSRARLTRQMLVESAVLTLPGLVIAAAVIQLSAVIEQEMVPHLQFRVGFAAAPDGRVIAFSGLVALIAIALFGLLPALRLSGARSLSSLIGAKRTTSGTPRRIRSALVVSQLALSVMLLVGATLFTRSLLLAQASDPGFDSRNRAVLSMNVGLQNYDEPRGRAFYDDVISQVRALPNVVSATWGFPVPFDTYGRSVALYVPGASTGTNPGVIGTSVSIVSEDFDHALGLRITAGRSFTIADSVGAPRVMLVSERLAKRLWPGTDPVGQTARRGSDTGAVVTVIGVVRDAKFESFGPASLARAYLPLRQNYRDWQSLIVQTRSDAASALPAIKGVVTTADQTLPVFGMTTMHDNVTNGLSTSRTAAVIAGFFGILALLISSVGLYAVVASGVSERTREIGVRMALGSTPVQVLKLVMGSGARLGGVGLVIGLVGAAIVARLMAALLFGLSPADPITFVLVPAVLVVVVLVATYVPARRAVKLDPVAALRSE